MAKGGARPNAGRKPGSRNKICVADLLSDEEKAQITGLYFETAKQSEKVLVHLIDQLYGKARQNIGLDGGEDGAPVPLLILKNKNALRTDDRN